MFKRENEPICTATQSVDWVTYHFGFEGRFNFFPVESVPIDGLEERLVTDFAAQTAGRAEPFLRIFLQQQNQNGFRLFGQEARIVGLFVANAPEELVLVAAVERRLSHHHFVEEDTERPPIDALVVFEPFDDLCSNIRQLMSRQ